MSLLLTARHLTEAKPILLAPEGELLARARAAGLETQPLPSFRARLSRNPVAMLYGMLGMACSGFHFALAIRKLRPDLVHANSLRAGLMASAFAWLHGRPVVWHMRDNIPGGFVGSMIRYVSRGLPKAVIGISQAVLSGFAGMLPEERKHLVHNGVEVSPLPAERIREAAVRIRAELQTPPEAEVLLCIGQIALWKRQEDAIRATARLISEGREVYLWIVGEAKFRHENTEYERFLRRLAHELGIAERVIFTGFRSDIEELCSAADLLVLCSDKEPFGRVLIEAMAQSLPVVATNAGGVPEVVDDGVTGLLYEVGEVDALVRRIRELLSQPYVMATMGRLGAERVRACFTIDRTAARVEDVYRKVLGRGRPSVSVVRGRKPRVAIVHDYLIQMGGAERVVAALHRMYPEAPIFTSVCASRSQLLADLRDADIRTTWMQHIPGIQKRFKLFFWLYPFAFRTIDLAGYDLILSSSSAYAKGIRKPHGAKHICYCHSPMRFAWSFEAYTKEMRAPKLLKAAARLLQAPLRLWDKANTAGADVIAANSNVVKERIRACYGRNAPVIYPPVEISRFALSDQPPGEYFLVVSRLVSYKRIDLAVEAATRLNVPLIVVGEGPDRSRLEELAGPRITFAGRLSDEEVVQLLKGCRALLFPGLEDFGITPLEANACGRPVLAYGEGGALDTVMPGVTGLLFPVQTPGSLMTAMQNCIQIDWDERVIRQHAESFGETRFRAELSVLIERTLQGGEPQQERHPAPITWKRSVGS